MEGVIASAVIKGHRQHFCARKTTRIQNWWINAPGLKAVKAVFCRMINGRLIPLQEEEMALGEYEPGKNNPILVHEKEYSK